VISLFLHSVFTTLGLALEKKAQYAGLFHITYIVLVRGEIRINLCIFLRRGGVVDTETNASIGSRVRTARYPNCGDHSDPDRLHYDVDQLHISDPLFGRSEHGGGGWTQTNVVTPFPTNFAETQISTTAFETSLPTYTTMSTIPTSDPPVSSPIADPQTDGPVLKCVVSVSH
jgi:hypothetical protein